MLDDRAHPYGLLEDHTLDPRLAGHRTYRVVIYRDKPFWPRLFGNRLMRPVMVSNHHTHTNHEDPQSLLETLASAVAFDRHRGSLASLADYSMDVYLPPEYAGDPEILLWRGWRYSPSPQTWEAFTQEA